MHTIAFTFSSSGLVSNLVLWNICEVLFTEVCKNLFLMLKTGRTGQVVRKLRLVEVKVGPPATPQPGTGVHAPLAVRPLEAKLRLS